MTEDGGGGRPLGTDDDDDVVAVYELNEGDGRADDAADGEEDGDAMHVDDDGGDEEAAEGARPQLEPAVCEFAGHSQDVFAVDCGGALIATGGEDDRAFVFSLAGGDQPTYHQLDGHGDSVVCVAFRKDDRRLATGDMAGKVHVWDTEQQAFSPSTSAPPPLICSVSTGGDLHWLRWHPSGADILLAGDAAGSVWMWLLARGKAGTSGSVAQTKVYAAGRVPCIDGVMLPPDGKRLCALYEDGTARLWLLKESTNTLIHQPASNRRPDTTVAAEATALAVHQSQPLAAIGAADGHVTVCHYESGKVAGLLDASAGDKSAPDADGGEASRSVESLAFNSANLLAVGTSLGRCAIWDAATMGRRHELPVPPEAGSVTKLSWLPADRSNDTSDFVLLAASYDGIARAFDGRSGLLLRSLRCHDGPIFDMKVDRDKGWLITVGGDSLCRVFDVYDGLNVA